MPGFPTQVFPAQEKPTQLSTKPSSTKQSIYSVEQEENKKPRATKKKLTKEEVFKKLCEKYDPQLVEKYMDKAIKYKNCMNVTKISTWIEEDKKKGLLNSNDRTSKEQSNNRFNNFTQRPATEEMFEIKEKILQGYATKEEIERYNYLKHEIENYAVN